MLRTFPFSLVGLNCFALSFIMLFAGCGVQNKLTRKYKGENIALVISELGRPTSVEDLPGERRSIFYEKKTTLKSASINTGHFRYDPLESPGAVKIETFRFFVNSSGLIENVKYEYRYER